MNGVWARAPIVLRSIAVLGVVVAVVGTVVIWQFLGDLEQTTDRSLLIGEQATETLTDTIDIADQVLDAVDDGLVTVQSTLGTLEEVLQATAGLAGATASLATALPAGLDNVDAALATVQQIGATIDSALETLSALPFGPDYDPATSFSESIGGLREAVAPIAENLTAISTELQNFADGSGDLTNELNALVTDVERARDALVGTDELLDQYRDAAADAGQLAAETRDQLSTSMTRMRWVLVALGLLLALSQYVPWTLASALQAGLFDARATPHPETLA